MNDLKAIKAGINLQEEIARTLGQPKSKGETWVWPCPFRAERTPGAFHVWKDGYKCFSCGEHGDYFDWLMYLRQQPLTDILRGLGVSPDKIREQAAENARDMEERLKEQIARAQAILGELQTARKWEEYHAQMTAEARQLWTKRGVPEWYQDFAYFGYRPDYTLFLEGTEYHTPTLTIPIFEPVTRNCLNIRHRLLNPPNKDAGNKYRPERSGLGSQLFVADPDKAITGKVLVVEGEIKAAVTFATLDNPDWQVVGIPGKTPRADLLEQINPAEQVVICLDPDAGKEAREMGEKLGKSRVRLWELPGKIDDMITGYGLGKEWVMAGLNHARKL